MVSFLASLSHLFFTFSVLGKEIKERKKQIQIQIQIQIQKKHISPVWKEARLSQKFFLASLTQGTILFLFYFYFYYRFCLFCLWFRAPFLPLLSFFSLSTYFSGKLPLSYPKATGSANLQYYHKVSEEPSFLWEFGHGLSYSTIVYSNLQVLPSPLLSPSLIKSLTSRSISNDLSFPHKPLPPKKTFVFLLTLPTTVHSRLKRPSFSISPILLERLPQKWRW